MFPWNLTIAANETMPVAASGSFVYVDKAEGTLRLEAYNEGKRVAEVPLSFAREANLPFFTKLYVTDTSGAENTVRLLVGGENEGYERNGSEITGPVGPGGGVQVEDPDGGGESFAEIIALLKNALDQRAPLTTLAGATLASVSGSSSTVVTAGENVNGVVIRFASASAATQSAGASNGASAFVSVDGVPIIKARAAAAGDDSTGVGAGSGSGGGTVKDFFVPSGLAVVINASGGADASIAYEVL